MSTVNINAANISSIRLADSAAPSAPASGFIQLYADSNGDLATVKDNSGGIKIATNPASSAFTLTVDGTGTAARLNADQTFTGDNTFDEDIIMANGKGIDFSATPGTGTSEILDDYEEGTWTPVIIGSTSAGSASYTDQDGRYTKIGRMVYIECYVEWSGGTGTGGLRIDGLPFTSANIDTFPSLAIGALNNVPLTAANVPMAYVNKNSDQIVMWQSPIAGGTSVAVPYDAAGGIQVAGCYTV